MVDQPKTFLVTGGAGFIGSNFVRVLLDRGYKVVNLDALTYAGQANPTELIRAGERHIFVHGSIVDRNLVSSLMTRYRPSALINIAAETHVDRSIDNPGVFVNTNVMGTFELLEATKQFYDGLADKEKIEFRFVQVSTDEVYGSIEQGHFTENSPFEPNSPYAASKAGADHLVRAYHKTFGLPVIITRGSNNYGPFQYPEKLIPHMILSALSKALLTIYGDGGNIRDWIHVQDHCHGILSCLERGRIGEAYNIASDNEKTNIEVVNIICDLLDQKRPREDRKPYRSQITFVEDRPGHDRRYSLSTRKISEDIGWQQSVPFEKGLADTIDWYLSHEDWTQKLLLGGYEIKRIGLAGRDST